MFLESIYDFTTFLFLILRKPLKAVESLNAETNRCNFDTSCITSCAEEHLTEVCIPYFGTAEPQGSQGTQTRGTWDVCITEGCSSIKRQIKSTTLYKKEGPAGSSVIYPSP